MGKPATFELQGHRGARGLKPENTLPAFEIALDAGVTSIETDLHLTEDGIPILFHDATIHESLCELLAGSASPAPETRPLLRTLSLEKIRGYAVNRNPDARRFPAQDDRVTPLTERFALDKNLHPFALPTLAELFAFAQAYAGPQGKAAGKTTDQEECARRVIFDLELKRVPFRPHFMADEWSGSEPGQLEKNVLEAVRDFGLTNRVRIRSFEHRSVQRFGNLAPEIVTAVLVGDTAPVSPSTLVRQAGAQYYCPSFEFLDQTQVEELHAAGFKVLPWTVNEPADWEKLLAWGVDGITTDYPDRLAAYLRDRKICF